MGSRRRQIIWSNQATAALDEETAYLSQESQSAAIRLLKAALEAAASLAHFAERGRIVPELRLPTIRELFVFRYRLMYEVANGQSR